MIQPYCRPPYEWFCEHATAQAYPAKQHDIARLLHASSELAPYWIILFGLAFHYSGGFKHFAWQGLLYPTYWAYLVPGIIVFLITFGLRIFTLFLWLPIVIAMFAESASMRNFKLAASTLGLGLLYIIFQGDMLGSVWGADKAIREMDGIKNFGLTALIGGAVVTVFSIIGARKRNESFRNNILEFVGSKTKTSMDQQQNDANKGFLVLMCISAGADLILYFIPGIVIGIMSSGLM